MDNQTTTDIGILDQFQTEFAEFWHRLDNKGFFFVLLVCWLTLFQFFGNATFGYIDTPSLFRWMWSVYHRREPDGSLCDDSIGIWVPVLVLGLVWWKQKELVAQPPKLWWPGLLLVLLGLVLHVLGFFIQQPRLSIMAMLAGVYGLMGLAWGREWMCQVFFPFFLLLFLVPLSTVTEPITFPLRLMAAAIVQQICDILLGFEVARQGTILADPQNNYHFEVAAACSGIRSLVGVGLMGLVAAFVFFKQWWRRGVMLALVIPLAVAGNVLRLLTIIIAAKIGGQDWGAAVHDGGPGGVFTLLPYVPGIFALMYLGRRLEEPRERTSDPS